MVRKEKYGMSDGSEAEFDRAKAHFEAGNCAAAEMACRALLDSEPNLVDGHHLLGVILLQAGRPEDAVEAFSAAVELAPEEPEILGNMAVAYEASGASQQAANAYRTAINLDPADPHLNAAFAAVSQRLGEHEAAVGGFRRAIELGEVTAENLYGLALAEKVTNQLEDAIATCRRLIQQVPEHLEALYLQAVCLSEDGSYESASKSFERLISIEPDFPGAHGNYAVLLTRLNRRSEAYAAFELAVTAPDVDANCFLNFAMMLEEDKQEARAYEFYCHAFELEESFAVCGGLARQAMRLNKNAEVAELFAGLTLRQPALPFAWFYLGQVLVEDSQAAAARRAMEQYLSLDPEDKLGSQLVLGAGGAIPLPAGPGEAYLKNFYRSRAAHWDETVVEAYNGHDIIMGAFDMCLSGGHIAARVLDAGCGTGSLGVRMKPSVGSLDGVDLSPHMVGKAQEKNIYDTLETGDLFNFLVAHEDTYDIVVAAAILFHFRDLTAALKPIFTALRPSGQVIFTLFKNTENALRLNDQGFFEHSSEEIKTCVAESGLQLIDLHEAVHEYNFDDEPRPCFCVRCGKS
jgi:predicted TPR repeat methyltransferase